MDPGNLRAGHRTIAIVPVRALEGAKSRLGDVLDAEERRDLVVGLLARTLEALGGASGIDAAVVVSSDEAVLEIARDHGAIPLRQLGGGLNAALEQARTVAVELGAGQVVVLPGDLPAVTAAAIDRLVDAVGEAPDGESAGAVILVPDRHGRGTNALVLRPPGVIPFAFGGDSRLAHAGLARAAGARYEELGGPLDLDVDTPEDLLLADAASAAGRPDDPGATGARAGVPR